MIAIRKMFAHARRRPSAEQRLSNMGLIAALIVIAMMGGLQRLAAVPAACGARFDERRRQCGARRASQPRRVPNTTSLTFWPGTSRLFAGKPFNDRNRSSLKSR